MINELSNNDSNKCQYTISNNSYQNSVLPNESKCQIYEMDTQQNKNEQTLLPGYITSTVSNYENNQLFAKLENDLNLIEISDSEDDINNEPLNEEQYLKSMDKINDFYEEEQESNSYFGTKNEQLKIECPKPHRLNEKSKVEKLGIVSSIVDGCILIEGRANIIINLDATVFNKNCDSIGFIFDIIGNIDFPYYVVKSFDNEKDTVPLEKVLEAEEVFVDINFSATVNKTTLLNNKGTDASNAFDEEINENDLEFSDDEEERNYKNSKKTKKFKEDNNNSKNINLSPSTTTTSGNVPVNNLDPFSFINQTFTKN